jgi:hypothetical protein
MELVIPFGSVIGPLAVWLPRRHRDPFIDQVVEVRYQAGSRFGSGFKARPKSDAGIRELPLAPLLVESIRRQLPPDPDPEVLVFTGPGGGNGVPTGSRTMLSRYNFRRVYQRTRSPALAMTLLRLSRTDPTICATPSRPGWKTSVFPLG